MAHAAPVHYISYIVPLLLSTITVGTCNAAQTHTRTHTQAGDNGYTYVSGGVSVIAPCTSADTAQHFVFTDDPAHLTANNRKQLSLSSPMQGKAVSAMKAHEHEGHVVAQPEGLLCTANNRSQQLWCLDATCVDTQQHGCFPLTFVKVNNSRIDQSQPLRFHWVHDGHGRFLSKLHNMSACLDLYRGGVGPAVGIYRCDGLESQQWVITNSSMVQTQALPTLGHRCLKNDAMPNPPSPPPVPSGPFVLDRAGMEHTFFGLGAISGGGATSRLLVDYPSKQQDQILDILFKPNFGASLQLLKVEIGGDLMTTDGSESSHMHDNHTVDCQAGYEWWLMTEAKKRNPNIKLYGLPWAYPGWVGNNPETGEPNASATPFDYPDQTARYVLEWVKGAKTEHGLDIDYIGIWNEAPCDANYVKILRSTLDDAGFGGTRIVAQDGGAQICTALAEDSEYARAVDIIGLHYPSDFYNLSSCHALGKPVWASEESSSYDDLNGAACWARVVNSHYSLSGITSSIMWNLVGAYYPGTSWYASSMLTANQPWSGWYGVRGAGGTTTQIPVVWATAHVTQFTNVGWRYLKPGYGSGELHQGGFYNSIVDPHSANFTLNVVKISYDHASCTRPTLPPSQKHVCAENATFKLNESMNVSITRLSCWRSNFELETPILFEKQSDIVVVNGEFTLNVDIGDYFTISTISTAVRGSFSTPVPQSQPRVPMPIEDDFNSIVVSQQPRLWSQMTGSFEARLDFANKSNTVLRQTGTQIPLSGWRGRFTMIPATIVGMREWQDVDITVDFRLPIPSNIASACVGARVDWTLNVGVMLCIDGNGLWNFTYGGGSRATEISTGRVTEIPRANTWNTISLTALRTSATAYYNNQQLFGNLTIRDIDYGFAALATNSYCATEFDNVKVSEVGPDWDPNPKLPAGCPIYPSSGTQIFVRRCQGNGVAASDQDFYLMPDWRLVHAESKLCVAAAAAQEESIVVLQPCNSSSTLQLWKNDYSNIHHSQVPLVLSGPNLTLAGSYAGDVRTQIPGQHNRSDWDTWTFFDSTGQLRNQRTAFVASEPVMCLSLCKD